MTQAPQPFHQAISEHLGFVDELLAVDGEPLRSRPFPATVRFVIDFVHEVNLGPEGPRPPGDASTFVLEPWFAMIHAAVREWYKDRYGGRMAEDDVTKMTAVTLVARTPFAVEVPVTTSTPGISGGTVRLGFPRSVRDGENALAWIVDPPGWNTYAGDAIAEATMLTTEVATRIRQISANLLGAKRPDEATGNILAGVKIHLDSAAHLILRAGQDGGFARAQWELQMASESAFKGLLQQRTGTFVETHDLFILFDQAQPFCPNGTRALVKELPRWNEAANLRYGLGDHPTVYVIFSWYRTSLALIAQTVQGLQGFRVSDDGYLEIQRAPWLTPPDTSEAV